MRTYFKTLLAGVGMLLAGVFSASAQDVAIKTNLLHDATLTPNLGLEFGLAPKWTLDISADVNMWPINYDNKERYWERWMVQPEIRYWFCNKFQGHFIALHAIGGQFNVGNIGFLPNFLNNRFEQLKDERWRGWGVGAGFGYGYAWTLGKHWNLEAEIAVGWMYSRYDRITGKGASKRYLQKDKVHNYVGPTKLALSIEYLF